MSRPNRDTIGNTINTAEDLVIPNGASGTDTFDAFVNTAADQDWFRITLRAGELYQFTASQNASTVDPTLALRNAVGNQIDFDNNSGPGNTALITYRATTDQVVFLDVGGFNTTTGAYTIVAREVPANVNTYSSVGVNSSITGNIGSAADQDWHAIFLVAGQQYIFNAGTGTLADATLGLRNAAGNLLVSDDNSGPNNNARIDFTAAVTGTYYLDVGGNGTSQGSYTLGTRIDDAADTIETFDALAIGTSRVGTINDADDQDFFSIFLSAGQQYIFDVSTGSLADPTLSLRNSAGGEILFDDDGGPGFASRIEFTAGVSGTYYLDVGGLGSGTGTYTVAARIDDVANDINTLDTLAIGASRTGTINIGADQDFVRVSLVAGTSYIFDVPGGMLADTTLTLRDGAGTSLVFNDDGGPGVAARIEFTASTTGTYYLDVGSFGESIGTYTLASRIDDAADDIDTLDTIAVNGFRSGTINSADDSDFFAINLVAGTFYVFDATAGSLADPTLTLRNNVGTQLAFDDDTGSGLNAQIGWTATYTGVHFLDVDGFGTSTGTYSLFG